MVFRSRATRTTKEYSDLDLAVLGDEPLTVGIRSALVEELGESDLPFKADLVDWARIDELFRDIIHWDGVPLNDSEKAERPSGKNTGMLRGVMGKTGHCRPFPLDGNLMPAAHTPPVTR